ncbi:MAG: hypothetical protein FGM34_06450 [Solirubrobacteraceae bacterium]|nr:hypothetical protein [Solirubrobacteraceae bacterium]
MVPAVPNPIFQAGRIAIGAAFVADPERAGERWVGPGTAGADGGVMGRAFGVRDLALGTATVAAQARGSGYRTLLALGVACDAVDLAATLMAGDRIPSRARQVTAAVAAIATLNGVLLLANTLRD